MHVLSYLSYALPGVSAWSFGGSILTFAFPMILFIAVASTLWVLYTKPELVPGRPAGAVERPVSYTPVPGQPAVEAVGAHGQAAAQGAQAAPASQAPASQAPAGQAPAEPGEARIGDGEAARTEDGE